jgi:hypothetical protein
LDQHYLPFDLRHGTWIATALLGSSIEKGSCSLEGVIVPMCQSPKIADVLLRTQKIPANDNHAPVEKSIKVGPASPFRTTCQTLLIFCCAAAFLLL